MTEQELSNSVFATILESIKILFEDFKAVQLENEQYKEAYQESKLALKEAIELMRDDAVLIQDVEQCGKISDSIKRCEQITNCE